MVSWALGLLAIMFLSYLVVDSIVFFSLLVKLEIIGRTTRKGER